MKATNTKAYILEQYKFAATNTTAARRAVRSLQRKLDDQRRAYERNRKVLTDEYNRLDNKYSEFYRKQSAWKQVVDTLK